MEKLVSSWFTDTSLPQDYIFPSDKRPGKDHAAAPCNTIPVIDLGKADGGDRNDIIQQILEASQDFGFFQVIFSRIHKLSFLIYTLLFLFSTFLEFNVSNKTGSRPWCIRRVDG